MDAAAQAEGIQSDAVVRFGALKMVGEFPYTGTSKPGCGSKIVVRTFRGTDHVATHLPAGSTASHALLPAGYLKTRRVGLTLTEEGTRLLRPLFQTVEINLISSRNTSGLHPFGSAADFIPELDIQIPGSFFLNVQLLAGGGTGGLGGL